jgi:Mrp family chromosome partitioning ATPase
MLAEPSGSQAESYRILRTNLEFANLDRGARLLMITSALEREGKSTTALNLAVALARAGRRVVAVDLDLRRSVLASLLGIDGEPGVTDVALGRVGLTEALGQVVLTGADPRRQAMDAASSNGKGNQLDGVLEVLTAGIPPHDAGEFVTSRALADILAELRERADFVLVDVPPLLSVGDAIAVSGLVDGIIAVVRLKTIRRPALAEFARVLETCPAAKLGFVVTGTPEDAGYGGGYYAYSSRQTQRARIS